ncbi:MAG: hypothetical protein A3E80_02145 [Chlamydiae bacterium RIFCSPHIGHO2_12_FULL_49_9]|nr:MAG: hypothetical protein A3E80_02145 [Chlamydiae bacterium RIFCSPHIGHO2_12_FULL_49_9]
MLIKETCRSVLTQLLQSASAHPPGAAGMLSDALTGALMDSSWVEKEGEFILNGDLFATF